MEPDRSCIRSLLIIPILFLLFSVLSAQAVKSVCLQGCDMTAATCGLCQDCPTCEYKMCDSTKLWFDSTAQVSIGRGDKVPVWECDHINDYNRGHIQDESGMDPGECTCADSFRSCLRESDIEYNACLGMKDPSTPYQIVAAQCAQAADGRGRPCSDTAGTCYASYMSYYCTVEKQSCIAGCATYEQNVAAAEKEWESQWNDTNKTAPEAVPLANQPEANSTVVPDTRQTNGGLPCAPALVLLAGCGMLLLYRSG